MKSKLTEEEGKGEANGKKVDTSVEGGICESKDQSLWETANKVAGRQEHSSQRSESFSDFSRGYLAP